MSIQSLVCSRDHLWVIGQPQVVVRTEIDDRMWFAVVIEGGPRLGWTKKLRFVQLNEPLPKMVPSSKGRWRFQGIFAVANKKIAQAKPGRMRLHTQATVAFRK